MRGNRLAAAVGEFRSLRGFRCPATSLNPEAGGHEVPEIAAPAQPYNETVPMEFTRALLVQARASGVDVDAILQAAGFPFDPLRQSVQTLFVSREHYSRLCLELFRAIGDESGGIMPDVQTPPGTMRLIALSMLNSRSLAAALKRAIEFNAVCRVRQGTPLINRVEVDKRT